MSQGGRARALRLAPAHQGGELFRAPEGIPLRAESYGRFLDRSRNIYFIADAIE
jgi:hypothetical protein